MKQVKWPTDALLIHSLTEYQGDHALPFQNSFVK